MPAVDQAGAPSQAEPGRAAMDGADALCGAAAAPQQQQEEQLHPHNGLQQYEARNGSSDPAGAVDGAAVVACCNGAFVQEPQAEKEEEHKEMPVAAVPKAEDEADMSDVSVDECDHDSPGGRAWSGFCLFCEGGGYTVKTDKVALSSQPNGIDSVTKSRRRASAKASVRRSERSPRPCKKHENEEEQAKPRRPHRKRRSFGTETKREPHCRHLLIRCSGPCNGCFHLQCVPRLERDLASLAYVGDEDDIFAGVQGSVADIESPAAPPCPPVELPTVDAAFRGDWLCPDCTRRVHMCYICKNRSPDGEFTQEMMDDVRATLSVELEGQEPDDPDNPPPGAGPVMRCSRRNCGYFYHLDCLMRDSNTFFFRASKFECPLHLCRTCEACLRTRALRRIGSSARLYPCIRCASAYHSNCLPPLSRELQDIARVFCYNHQMKRTTYGYSAALGEDGENEAGSAIGDFDTGEPYDWSIGHPTDLHQNPSAVILFPVDSAALPGGPVYWLPPVKECAFRIPESELEKGRAFVDHTPPVYQKILTNQYLVPKPPALHKDDRHVCNCRPEGQEGACGPESDCINRSMSIECDSQSPCGAQCLNRRLQRRQYAKSIIRRVPGKGFGLFAKENVSAGDLIVEYVGEVIDEATCYDRLTKKLAEEHLYMFKISSSMIIDAEVRGNHARFVNHSCHPNCCTQKWTVGNTLRVGIFAAHDIAAGEEFTYDYNFEGYWSPGSAQKCLCGAANCSGFLGERPKKLDARSSGKNGTKRKTTAEAPSAAEDSTRKQAREHDSDSTT